MQLWGHLWIPLGANNSDFLACCYTVQCDVIAWTALLTPFYWHHVFPSFHPWSVSRAASLRMVKGI